jgi:hypothetical protein
MILRGLINKKPRPKGYLLLRDVRSTPYGPDYIRAALNRYAISSAGLGINGTDLNRYDLVWALRSQSYGLDLKREGVTFGLISAVRCPSNGRATSSPDQTGHGGAARTTANPPSAPMQSMALVHELPDPEV